MFIFYRWSHLHALGLFRQRIQIDLGLQGVAVDTGLGGQDGGLAGAVQVVQGLNVVCGEGAGAVGTEGSRGSGAAG